MLVLSRLKGERILIGDSISVVLVEIRGSKARLGIEAPTGTEVDREEVRIAKHGGGRALTKKKKSA